MSGALPAASFAEVGHIAGDRRVLDRVTFEVSLGEHVAIVGSNGSGKSTLARLAAGLVVPISGSVSLFGVNLATASETTVRRLRGRVSLALQGGSLIGELSVEDNLRLGIGAVRAATLRRLRARIDRILLNFSLEAVSSREVDALSTGERRRLELARAFLREPDFIVLDDPFEGLDPTAAASLEQRVRALLNRRLCACLVLTSDPALAQRFTTRVYTLAQGALSQ